MFRRRLPPFVVLLAAGCGGPGGGYDPGLRFPPRADPVVVRPPAADAPGPHRPGTPDPELFALADRGGVVRDPAALPPAEKAELGRALDDLFGTPSAPRLPGREAAAPRLARGAALYKDKCAQCHGLSGDGRGPTGRWVTPPPRDFRRGAYKFVSTRNGLPSRGDLARVIRTGLSGNAMPGFGLLPDDDVAALADYTAFLGVRGRVEFDAVSELSGDGLDEPLPAFAAGRATAELARWAAAADVPVPAPPDLDAEPAVRAGYELFRGPAGCLSCHKDFGREDRFLYDPCGVPVRVTDLTRGEYRGGKEPADLFRRVRCGIPGSGMPAADLPDARAWELVAFLRALPTPRLLPADVRKAVYPAAE